MSPEADRQPVDCMNGRMPMIMDFDPDTHPIRITTHGKMKAWVKFALDFLDVRRFLPKQFSHSVLVGERGTVVDFPHTAAPWNTSKCKDLHRNHPSSHLRS